KLIESIRKLAHMGPGGLTSYGDVAVGYQAKSSRLSIGSSEFGPADTYDWGVNGRLALSRWWGEDATFRLSLSGAYSQINVPTSEARGAGVDRAALALRLSSAPPSEGSASAASLPWWRPGGGPGVSIGVAYGRGVAAA